MGLFSPWFVAGLAALGLPVWLHLLRQFKRTPQPFSSLLFFERRIQSSSQHRRLRYLLLLWLRLALLALLVLLFANPFINRASSAVAPRQLTVIALDRSFSMRFHDRLTAAKTQAVQSAQQLNGGRMQVMAVAAHTSAVTQPVADKQAAIEGINAMEASDETSSYGEFARAMRVMEQTTGLALNVHFFTDAQQTSMPAAFGDLRMGPHTSLTIHEIGSGPSPNWAVERVDVPPRVYDAENVRLTASLAGWQTVSASRKVSVVLDGKPLASKDVTIPASGRAELEFADLTIPFGAHWGQVLMTPHDDLPNDDGFAFSIERADPRKVLFLTAATQNAEAFFYESALNASPAAGLRVQSAPIAELPTLDLARYALVVLNNPGTLDEAASRALSTYVSKGGAAFIAVGPATVRAGAVPISGDRVSGTTSMQGAQTKSSAIFDSNVFDHVQFLATAEIKPGGASKVLATLNDGCPLLLEQAQGEGKLMVFASTLDKATSDFPVHSGFVPFVTNTGRYLTGGGDNASSVVVGSAVSLRQSTKQSASTDVIGPEGQHEFALSDATRVMSFNPSREGFYDIHAANGERRLLAVDADRRESNLEKVPAETLILWRNTSNGGQAEPGTIISNTMVPFSLWRYVLILVLLAALVESVFATRYLSRERQAA